MALALALFPRKTTSRFWFKLRFRLRFRFKLRLLPNFKDPLTFYFIVMGSWDFYHLR